MGMLFGIVGLSMFVLYFVCFWKISVRAGYAGAWSLTLLIPMVNLVMIYIFAFSTWPVLQNGDSGGDGMARAYTPGQHLKNEGPAT